MSTRRCDSCGHAYQPGDERCDACGNPLPTFARSVPAEELAGAYERWERLEILAPFFGVEGEVLTVERWLVAVGDVVAPDQPLVRIRRADGSTFDQSSTDDARVLDCLIPEGGMMEPRSRLLVLGPVTPHRDLSDPPVQQRPGCAAATVAALAALALAALALALLALPN